MKQRCIVIVAFVAAIVPASWAGDQQAATPTTAPYLLRMERLRPDQGVCVIVRRDGHYHLERSHPDSTRVFEGELPNGTVGSLESLLTKDRLFQLQQSELAVPHDTGNADQLFVSVLRPGHWQNLEFDTAESRKRYEEVLDPLLKWFHDLQKEKAKELTEESGRNNCLPAREVGLQTRSDNKALPQNTQGPDGQEVAAREARPNFSGTWKLNLTKSKPVQQPWPSDHLYKIEHVEPRFDVKLHGDIFHYIIDGKVHVAFRGLADGDRQMAKAYWDGRTLVIETSQEIGSGGTRWMSRFTLSEDGNTLAIFDHFYPSSFGGAHNESLVYEKQQ